VISFDLTNDTHGTHAAWPEIWITDKPTPAPFLHFMSVGGSTSANALGLRLSAANVVGQGACPNDGKYRWRLESAVAVRNYVTEDTEGFGTSTGMTVVPDGCVISPVDANGGMNHVEIKVSQNQIDVYATDAGTTAPLVHLGTVTNANLSFTRGLVWLEDVHYNADKGDPSLPSQRVHTFAWDNFAFDGPRLARDLSFDVPDNLSACHDGTLCLGWWSWQSGGVTMPAVSTMPMTAANIAASGAQFLMFNMFFSTPPKTISALINGHSYSWSWPFPYAAPSYPVQTAFIFPVNPADLVAGANTVQIWTDQPVQISNINIVLAGAGG
jgi:hypothetical protein